MSLPDARANVTRVANDGDVQAFCSADGRRAFREAVRTLSAAHDAAGEEPVDLLETSDPVWGLVFIGLLARIVEPGDLRGEMRSYADRFHVADVLEDGFSEQRAALEQACPELITLYRAAADVERLQARLQRLDNEDVGRRRDAARRLANADERAERAAARLHAKLQARSADDL